MEQMEHRYKLLILFSFHLFHLPEPLMEQGLLHCGMFHLP